MSRTLLHFPLAMQNSSRIASKRLASWAVDSSRLLGRLWKVLRPVKQSKCSYLLQTRGGSFMFAKAYLQVICLVDLRPIDESLLADWVSLPPEEIASVLMLHNGSACHSFPFHRGVLCLPSWVLLLLSPIGSEFKKQNWTVPSIQGGRMLLWGFDPCIPKFWKLL